MTLTPSSRRPILRHTHPTLILLLYLLINPTSAQLHNSTGTAGPTINDSPTISKSTAVVILILITSFFFMGFVSLYIRHCSDDSPASRRDPGGSVFRTRRSTRGLHPDLIDSFPIFTYAAVKHLKIGKYALECAVCLTEFDDDDSLRLLPHCDHVFHPDCVDTWLQAHATCPVCRADLHSPPASPPENPIENSNENLTENPSMEVPLRRDPTVVRRNASFGRVWGRIARSFSTGHVAVKQWENLERFRLRLPEEVRKEVLSGKLQRATSMVAVRAGEGSSRGRFRSARSDRWMFSFLSKTLSFKSPMGNGNASRQSSLRGSTTQAESSRLPV